MPPPNDSGKAPRIVFLHGPGAAGKYTIARELSALTGLPLFHNHLTVDLLLSVFPFGSPEFVRLRERIWLDVMTDAVAAGTSLIFTFNPERTVGPGFPAELARRCAALGGRVSFVSIECAEAEIERRIESDSRKAFRKLASLEDYRRLKAAGAFDFPPIPSEHLVDSSVLGPADAARSIASALDLLASP